MAIIRGGLSGVNLNVDPVSFALHATLYDTSGNLFGTSGNPLFVSLSGSTSTNITEVNGSPLDLGQESSASSLPVVIASDQSPVPISASSLPLPSGAATQATLASVLTDLNSILANQTNGTEQVLGQLTDNLGYKAAGGSNGGATGRIPYTLSALNFTAATIEALVTLTPSQGFVNGSTGTSFAIPSGYRFVPLGLTVTTRNASTATQGVVCRIRVNPTGAALVTSPVLAQAGAGTSIAIANNVNSHSVPISNSFPSDIELSGATQIGISQIGTATAGNDVVLWGYLY
jgi:hypothetical protein